MTDRPIAGFECKLYHNTANVGQTAQWVEIKNAKDVNLPDSVEAIEASARYSKSKRYIAGLFDGSIEFGYQYIRGTDAVFDELQDRYLTREPIEIAAADDLTPDAFERLIVLQVKPMWNQLIIRH